MDKEFINQVFKDPMIDLIEIVRLNIDIKDKLGLLSYKLINEDETTINEKDENADLDPKSKDD